MSQLPTLIADLALILICAGVMTLLFKKLKQPLVLGYVVAGFLASPHMPYTPSVMDTANIKTWADIGVIFLLFALGLEFSFKKIVKVGGTAVIAACTIIFCMILLGIAVGMGFGWQRMDSLFLGGMIAMSSTTIIYKAFDDLGLRKKQFTGLVLSILILEDILAIVLMVMLSTMVVGHEYVGEVVGIGQEVKGFKIGDRVSGEGHITCGHCRNCRGGRTHLCRNTIGVGVNRPGCFAEYLVIPAFNAFKIPDNISDDLASIFDPFGNAVHTALSFDLVGEDVLVSGAGPIGIMAAAVAKHVGARNVVITDVNEYRLELARKMGITRAVNVAKENLNDVMAELGMTEGFDVGLEMSGAPPAFRTMLDTMNHGGRIAMLGIPPSDMSIDWTKVIFKGLFIKGIYGREMFETWYKMAALIQSGLDLSPIITHRFSIDDFQKGFDAMRSGQSGKVILSWD